MLTLRCTPLLASVSLLLAVGCGDSELHVHEDHYVDHDMGVLTPGLTLAQAGGCDTSIAQALTVQLVEELNCMGANSMVHFAGKHTSLGNAVQPYLAPGAAEALRLAAQDAHDFITLSSAYRSVAQQYLLYKWFRAGLCYIESAAPPGQSNHQSGRAIDVPSYSFWIPYLQARGWKWFGTGDKVHFDFPNAEDLGAKSVLAFQRLWNKNRPNKLAEDGSWGASTDAAMAQAPAEGFAVHGCAPQPTPKPQDNTPTQPQVPQVGVVNGKVYQLNPKDAFDMSQPLVGATVTVGGKSVTTDGFGFFSLELAQGEYAVSATMPGYEPGSITRPVIHGSTVWAAIGLRRIETGEADRTPPALTLHSPENGSVAESTFVVLRGNVTDTGGSVAKLSIGENGQPTKDVPFEAGKFAEPVTLKVGENALALTAVDTGGNVTKLDVRLLVHPGLSGVVMLNQDASAPMAGVAVELENAQGTKIHSVTTDAQGRFSFNLMSLPLAGFVTVKADGYITLRYSVQVTAERREMLQLSLLRGSGVFDSLPELRFEELSPGSTVLEPRLPVRLRIGGFEPNEVKIGGLEARKEGELFTATVSLKSGANRLEAVATDALGRSLSASVDVIRLGTTQDVLEKPEPVTGCNTGTGGPLASWMGWAALWSVVGLRARARLQSRAD